MNVVANKMGIYLDNAATTKVDNTILDELNSFSQYYANPSSQYDMAIKARKRIEQIRKEIADFINAESEEIIFTSGATESNNFALKGLALANPQKKHIITSMIEHPAIIQTCKALEKQGYKIDYIPVNEDGIVDVDKIKQKINTDTLVVSVMHVNNEIGTIQPIEHIAAICRQKGVYFHTDAVQSFRKIDIDVKEGNIDLMSISGHKINALKGIGVLYIKIGTRIKPLIDGGEQEFKLRSGTENTWGIISLGKAIKIFQEKEKILKLRDDLIRELLKIKGSKLNGSETDRIYNNVNVSFYGIEGESLMLLLDEDGIEVSTGSACSSHSLEESHVLKAINVPELYIHGSIRITLSNDTTNTEVNTVVDKIKERVDKLRQLSPFKLEDEI